MIGGRAEFYASPASTLTQRVADFDTTLTEQSSAKGGGAFGPFLCEANLGRSIVKLYPSKLSLLPSYVITVHGTHKQNAAALRNCRRLYPESQTQSRKKTHEGGMYVRSFDLVLAAKRIPWGVLPLHGRRHPHRRGALSRAVGTGPADPAAAGPII